MSRPKGSKNKPKISPLVEEKMEQALDKAAKESGIKPKGIVELAKEFVPSKMEAIAPIVEDLMLVKEKQEQLKQKPTIINGPVFNTGKITKRINELTNHEALPFEETPFPEGWEKLSKVDKLSWLTANRKR